MKRKTTVKKIISLLLTVIMLGGGVSFVHTPVQAEAATTAHTYDAGFPRGDDPNRHHGGFGLLEGVCVNGFVYKESPANSLFFLDNSYSKLAYCIELGVDVDGGSEISTSDENSACEELARRVNNSATNISMTGEQMKTLLRSILGYGYHHDGSMMTEWKDIVNNSYQRSNYSYAYATQILVWELTSGERNADFEHVSIPAGYMSIYDHCIKPNNPLKADIDKYYRQIESDVQNATPTIDSGITEKTFTLQVNEAAKRMEVSIPDANGLFKNTSSIPGLTGAIITHNGSALNISVPFVYAKEGTYKLDYTIKHKVPNHIDIYLPSHSQDMIAATGGVKEVNTTDSLTIIVPHHHEWVPHVIAPTCTTEGLTCMMCKCGNIYTESVKSHLGHNTSSAWVVGQRATCTEAGELIQICERCNTVINSKTIEATGHSGVWIIETEATADHDGQMVLHCTKCGNRTETKSFMNHIHDFGYEAVVQEATCVTEGLMGKFCKYCEVCYDTTIIASGHSESVTWVTTMQPTCTAAGEASAFCNDCGDIVATKAVAATGHSDGIRMTSVAPFCGLSGEEICVCDRCGEITDSREIPALSHDEGVWKTVKDPTCELEGEKAKSCTRCGQITETQAIAAIGHDDGVWKIDIEASADIDGSMGRYCTRCSSVLETKTFTLHTHESGYEVTLLQPTCTRDGEKGIVCRICNAVFSTEVTAALGHDYSDFYTENNGTHSKSCSRCHYEYTENCNCEIIDSADATCTSVGFRKNKCMVCDYTYTDSIVAPYGHTLGQWISEGKSTHVRYCSNCSVMEVSKHTWGEFFSNNDGDILEEGSKTRSCIYCGETQVVGKPASILKDTFNATKEFLAFAMKLVDIFTAIMKFLGEILNVLSFLT